MKDKKPATSGLHLLLNKASARKEVIATQIDLADIFEKKNAFIKAIEYNVTVYGVHKFIKDMKLSNASQYYRKLAKPYLWTEDELLKAQKLFDEHYRQFQL